MQHLSRPVGSMLLFGVKFRLLRKFVSLYYAIGVLFSYLKGLLTCSDLNSQFWYFCLTFILIFLEARRSAMNFYDHCFVCLSPAPSERRRGSC